MKKTKFLFSVCLFALAAVSYGQMKMDAQGQAIYGSQPLANSIFIEDEYVSATARPFRIYRNSSGSVFLSRKSSVSSSEFGLAISPTAASVVVGSNFPTSLSTSYTLQVYPFNDPNTFGGILVNADVNSTLSGIRCNVKSSGGSPFVAYSISGSGSSTKIFEVNSSGNVYSATNYYSSDESIKKNIEPISTPLKKVMSLRGVTFDLITPEAGENASFDYAKEYERIKAAVPEITPEIFRQIQEEKKRKQMGVVAQEVEKIIPEVVRTREDGLKAVAYSEMVGLLIEAIKEQQLQIEKHLLLIEELEACVFYSKLRSESSAGEKASVASDEIIAGCQLYQNVPNPFSANTEIKYFLPAAIAKAHLYIHDMQGKQIKIIPLTQRGEGVVQILGSELSAGMYVYTLVADGKIVDTKRMILSEWL